jgi:hypothetical protein
MIATVNPFASFDITVDSHRFILGGGYDVKFYQKHTASVPSAADEAVVGNSMNSIARFTRDDDRRDPWGQLKEFMRAMELAWDIGRRDMQKDFRALLGVKNSE